jgi:WD40 repeat protein
MFAHAMLYLVKKAMITLVNSASRQRFRQAAMAILFLATSIAWGIVWADSPSVAVGVPQALPELRYVRTLPAPNEISMYGMFQSGTAELTWSPDGERLAAYIHNGLDIIIWSPDGKYQFEFPRHARFGPDSYALKFLFGHSKLIASPSAQTNNLDEEEKVEQNAFSVIDATTGEVLHGVAGPNPGKTFKENVVRGVTISPDQAFVAIIYHPYAGPIVGIYSTNDWRRIATIDIADEERFGAQAIAFSPDGKKLAVAYGGNARLDIFEVGTWKMVRTIHPFPEEPPSKRTVFLGALAFSPDGTMIAAASRSGGTFWKYPNGALAPFGVGKPVEEFPSDPLRIFRVEDGSLVASASGFPAGFLDQQKLAWAPTGDFIAFLDGYRQLHVWNPTNPTPPQMVQKRQPSAGGVVFSPNGAQLAVNFADGAKIYDVIPGRK